MKLVYKATQVEVKVGDKVETTRGEKVTVLSFRNPTSPASEGKVHVSHDGKTFKPEYYVGVIGAEWIEREDR